MILYRYLDYDGGLATLQESSLKVTRPIDYNDPFECLTTVFPNRNSFRKDFWPKVPKEDKEACIEFELRKSGITKPTEAEYRQAKLSAKRRVRESLEKSYQKIAEENALHRLETLSETTGVICFTKNMNNALMWSHYCNGHRGIVMGVETEECFGADASVIEIKYSDKPPSMNFLNGHLSSPTSGMKKYFLQEVVGKKSDIWAYEQEFRIQIDTKILKRTKDKGGKELLLFSMPKKAIRRVVFGCKLGKHQVNKLEKVLGDGYKETFREYALPRIDDYTLEYANKEKWMKRQAQREALREHYRRCPL